MRNIMRLGVGLLFFATLSVPAKENSVNEVPAKPESSQGKRKVTATLPRRDSESRAERERKYRSCLFTYLPRMGSDVAAEIIRDACEAEYLR